MGGGRRGGRREAEEGVAVAVAVAGRSRGVAAAAARHEVAGELELASAGGLGGGGGDELVDPDQLTYIVRDALPLVFLFFNYCCYYFFFERVRIGWLMRWWWYRGVGRLLVFAHQRQCCHLDCCGFVKF